MLTLETLKSDWLSASRVVALIGTGRLLTEADLEAEVLAGFRRGVKVGPDERRECQTVTDTLAAAVLAGRLAAWGRRATSAFEKDHSGPLERIPAEHFVRVYVTVGGWTFPRDFQDGGPHWWQVAFRRGEVLALWPPQTSDDDDRAALLLAAQSAAQPRMKREAGLAWTRAATACTDREARRAWGRLPDRLRGARGKKVS